MSPTLDSMLTGSNATYIAELYARYLGNPNAVDPSWVSFFKDLKDDGRAVLDELRGASWRPSDARIVDGARPEIGGISDEEVRSRTLDSIRALMMIRNYRVRGHLIAKFDPLGIEGQENHPELDYRTYGFTEADMERPIFIDNVLGLESASLREILSVLKETYCGAIGVDFMHIQEPEEKAWIQRRIEAIHNRTEFTLKGKRAIYQRLVEAEGLETFLHKKYTGTKRFGLDGGESLIPAMEQILKRGGQLGVKEVVLGMPHRGRLNVLANIMRKPHVAILSEFQGNASTPDDVEGSGDVKYHLGTSADRDFDGNVIHLSLTANPSHLEAVNPVVLGKVRAKQSQRSDEECHQVMGLLLHGDAAFAGQGLVPESLELSQLRGYRTGGTIHIVVNNQIGFTTHPAKSRSSPYCSDIAKGLQIPVFHVNGDEPEAVVHIARIAAEFRQEFKKDVVIDMFCYRRHGHNEGDEPMFTNPIMYKAIRNHPTTKTIYGERLIAESVLAADEPKILEREFHNHLEEQFQAATNYKPNKADWLEGRWSGLIKGAGEEEFQEYDTASDIETLRLVGSAISTPPKDFGVHDKIPRQLKAKAKMIETGEGIDWATAEALAFGTLMREGHPVRLSGQDSGRGTFSQRHSVLIDQETEDKYYPLSNISSDQAEFEVMDSMLSEAGVLGFEYGYSLAAPNTLTLWEAQFGDFANGAQVIIDQFISSGESKWLRMSGLVLLLPHGYEGQGPEHSSARPERYLQLCAEDNMQVCNITTPGNYFHALRRQVKRNFRKPLILMSPKSLLRHKLCVSKIGEMLPGTRFQRVIPEADAPGPDSDIVRVVLCSGKVYYDLTRERRERGIKNVAIIRVEQLYPWPRQSVLQQLARYKNAGEIIWCQEESANMGCWYFIQPRLFYVTEELGLPVPSYVGRPASASPATGLAKTHAREQAELVASALIGDVSELKRPFTRPGMK